MATWRDRDADRHSRTLAHATAECSVAVALRDTRLLIEEALVLFLKLRAPSVDLNDPNGEDIFMGTCNAARARRTCGGRQPRLCQMYSSCRQPRYFTCCMQNQSPGPRGERGREIADGARQAYQLAQRRNGPPMKGSRLSARPPRSDGRCDRRVGFARTFRNRRTFMSGDCSLQRLASCSLPIAVERNGAGGGVLIRNRLRKRGCTIYRLPPVKHGARAARRCDSRSRNAAARMERWVPA